MEIIEVVRRWQAGESQRHVARSTGLARETVAKYLRAASALGLQVHGPPPTEAQVGQLLQAGRTLVAPRTWAAPQRSRLEPYREQIQQWLQHDHLQLSRVHELLATDVAVSYSTLERYAWRLGVHPRQQPRASTVRLASTAPGEVAEMDFERLGPLLDPPTGRRQVVWGLSVVLIFSRHSFLWPLVQQTLPAVIEGLDAAWRFFGGCPQRLILDNFPAAIAQPDALEPRLTRGFLEYSQARGFLVDPARVRHPRDKPHVERGVQYARERFWKGGTFADLADARQQAERWCREVAGQRVHGTTRQLPLVVFEDQERAHLRPYGGTPYDLPLWREVTVAADHHVTVQAALYSVPFQSAPPGTRLEARADAQLVHLYRRGAVIKVHPRQPRGGRSTDPADYPPERVAYALRAPERLIQQAAELGPNIGRFAERLLDAPTPWSKLRQAQKLVRLADRYTPQRLDAACARALGFDLLSVPRLERILVLALEQEGQPTPPVAERLTPLPIGRFVRTGRAFDHRFTSGPAPTPEVPA